MFYKYEIHHQNNEDVLYLYLSMQYEFSNELSLEDTKDLGRRTQNFIQANRIPFHGNKVYLIVDGIVVKSLQIEDIKNIDSDENEFSCDTFFVHIRLDDDALCEISLREYLLSVLMSKYMESIPDEVYKAMCVLYNTYAYKMMKEDGFLSSTNSFAIYKPISYYKSSLSSYEDVCSRLQSIITEVDCIFLSYQEDYILPFIHYSNSGKTLSNPQYPYLSSVKSLWDMASPYYIEIHDISYKEIYKKLSISLHKDSNITMVSKDSIKKVVLGDHIYTLEEFRTIFDLKSTDIYLIINKDHLRVITKGWGNSYGLSIFGACEIEKNGAKYYHILKYYFPKTKLLKYIKELS